MGIRAVLFDLDGMLVDSERQAARAMVDVLSRDHGLVVPEFLYDCVFGRSWNEIYSDVQAAFGDTLNWSMEELIRRSASERRALVAECGLPALPGAVDAVCRIAAQYKFALVTGSSREEAMDSLRAIGLEHKFATIFASEDYRRGKPSPYPYLAAASALSVAPKECLVLEDSAAGIASGRAAGMVVVAVKVGNVAAQDQSGAHRIVETLADIDDEFIGSLGNLP